MIPDTQNYYIFFYYMHNKKTLIDKIERIIKIIVRLIIKLISIIERQ